MSATLSNLSIERILSKPGNYHPTTVALARRAHAEGLAASGPDIPHAPAGGMWADGYDLGYHDGRMGCLDDAVAYHEAVLCHQPDCGCTFAAFLKHVHAY